MEDQWILCEHCIEAIRSRGEKIIILDTISQDIDYDEEKEQWVSEDDEPILKCSWCGEPNPELFECD